MASLFIKDSRTAELAAEVAAAMGTTKTEAVRDALERRRSELGLSEKPVADWLEWMRDYRTRHPLPQSTGHEAGKAFFDELWGEEP